MANPTTFDSLRVNLRNLTASATLTSRDAGKPITLNAAAGLTVTLPAATGSGDVFTFLVGTTVTSNTAVIKVANASDSMRGNAIMCADAGSSVVGFEAAANDDTITMNGTTTGGIRGDRIDVIDAGTNLFIVSAVMSGTGTEATPFSATVS